MPTLARRMSVFVPPVGLEPTTSRLKGESSNQLSYRGLPICDLSEGRKALRSTPGRIRTCDGAFARRIKSPEPSTRLGDRGIKFVPTASYLNPIKWYDLCMGVTRGSFYDAEAVRLAVEGASNQIEAIRALGFTAGADNYRRLREACVRYGIPMEHLRRPTRTHQQKSRPSVVYDNPKKTREALASAKTMRQACISLGIACAGKNYDMLEHWAVENSAPCPPRRSNGPRSKAETQKSKRDAIPKDVLIAAINASSSQIEVLTRLELKSYRENYLWLRNAMRAVGMKTLLTQVPQRGVKGGPLIPFEELYTKGVKRSQATLRRRVVEDGVLDPEKCTECGQSSIWNGMPLRLQLDHKNGDTSDNRVPNLRFLCPNCHSQTETFCRVKVKSL